MPEDARDNGAANPAQRVYGKTSLQASEFSGNAAKACRLNDVLCFLSFSYFNLTDFLCLTLLLKYSYAVRCEIYRTEILLSGHVKVVPVIKCSGAQWQLRPVGTTYCNANPAFAVVIY